MNALAIPAGDARRIVGVAARLRSDHGGEVVAAAAALARLLEPYGLRIEALVEHALAPAQCDKHAQQRTAPTPFDHRDAAEWCLEADCFNAVERKFLADAMCLARLSEKQSTWLAKLIGRREVEQ